MVKQRARGIFLALFSAWTSGICLIQGCGLASINSGRVANSGRVTPVISWPTPDSITYGTALGNLQLDATAGVSGTFVYTPAAGTVLNVGTQTLSVIFTPSDLKSYSTASASVSLQVNAPSLIQADLANDSVAVALGETVTDQVTIQAAGLTEPPTISLSGVPPNISVNVVGSSLSGTAQLAITPSRSAQPGAYTLEITVGSGAETVTLPLTLNVAYGAIYIGDAGSGPFGERLSTSIETSPHAYFSGSQSELPWLSQLSEQLLQIATPAKSVPQTSPDTWNFSVLDKTVLPLLTVGDQTPRIRIAPAPSFMLDPETKNFLDPTYSQFASYAQNLVRYYNLGGFIASDGYHVSSSATPVTWWSILNEPNHYLTPMEYVTLYNTVVPSMQAVDPSLKFAALDLSGTPSAIDEYIPVFVANVTARVDAVAVHFYSTSKNAATDSAVMETVPSFASRAAYIYTELGRNPLLANVPVWVTENNVDSYGPDSDLSVPDQRNWDSFLTAWRPYLFSQLAKVGVKALYHWEFNGSLFGEIDASTNLPRMSYWVDYWLAHKYPASSGARILQTRNSDQGELEELAVLYADGSVHIMVVNHAIANRVDTDGTGASRTVVVDVSEWSGHFSSASDMTIDSSTDTLNGPSEDVVPVKKQYDIAFSGYGVWFLTLRP